MKQQSLLNKRIPNLVALVLLVIGIGTISFLTKKGIIFQSGATPSTLPQNIRVTNITDTSFSVTYTTVTSATGSISWGKDTTLGTVLLDDRDQSNSTPQPATVHSMTVKNLLPNTKYYFSITSEGTTYSNNTIPFTATTGPPITAEQPSSQTISGSVLFPDKQLGSGVLVPQNGQMLSTITDAQGNYYISLGKLRTADFLRYLTVNPTDQVTLTLTDGTNISHITTNIENAQTIPAVTLAQDYDFIKTPLASTEPLANTPIGFPLFDTTGISGNTQIITPQADEAFTDQQPEFNGTAPPNTTVTIVIHSDEAIQAQVTADNNGQWTFRPEKPLSPGSHTITITTTDTSGNTKTATQPFTIFPAGTQVFQVATPAATLSPTVAPLPTNTPEPTITQAITTTPTPSIITTPTITPTVAITPTTAPSITPTPMATATPTAIATSTAPTPTNGSTIIPEPTKPPLPSTGNGSIFTIGIIGIITTIVGFVIFFITQGGSL
jgi:hypothetical protein